MNMLNHDTVFLSAFVSCRLLHSKASSDQGGQTAWPGFIMLFCAVKEPSEAQEVLRLAEAPTARTLQ